MYVGYMAFGGLELVNNQRAYVYNQMATGDKCGAVVVQDGEVCPYLYQAVNDDNRGAPYTTPVADNAPWIDPAYMVTGDFLGVYALNADGLIDGTRALNYVEGIADGGVLGAQRDSVREVKFKVMLVALSAEALGYGYSWLNASLRSDSCQMHGNTCGSTDMSYLVDCPPPIPDVDDYGDWQVLRTNLFGDPRAINLDLGAMPETGMWVSLDTPGVSIEQALPEEAYGIQISLPTTTSGVDFVAWGSDIGLITASEGDWINISAQFIGLTDGTTIEAVVVDGATLDESALVMEEIESDFPDRLGAVFQIPAGMTSYFVKFRIFQEESSVGASIVMGQPMLEHDDEVQTVEDIYRYFDYYSNDPNDDQSEYEWVGNADSSAAKFLYRVKTSAPMDYDTYQAEYIAPLRRYLHNVACKSAPTRTDSYVVQGVYLDIVEFTMVAATPGIYGATMAREFGWSDSVIVEDTVRNHLPYPSAEVAEDTYDVVVARNLTTNPSVEVDSTGWSGEHTGGDNAGNFTTGRTNERSAVGQYSFMNRVTGKNVAPATSGATTLTSKVTTLIDPLYQGETLTVTGWCELDKSGASTFLNGTVELVFHPGNEVVSIEALAEEKITAPAGYPVDLKFIPIPDNAVSCDMVWNVNVQFTQSTTSDNSVITLYTDAVAVTIP